MERERRTRDEAQIGWAPASLRSILHPDLQGDEILIASNREPYVHVRRDERMEVQRPASGLVTALEPVIRACSGGATLEVSAVATAHHPARIVGT